MRTVELKDVVVKWLSEHEGRAPDAGQIGDGLQLRGKQKKQLQKVLHELSTEGTIVVVRDRRYTLGAPADLLTGTLDVVRSGNAFVQDASQKRSLFVASENTGTALPGDRVVVRRERVGTEDDRPSGRVIRILERARRDLVGTLKSTGRFLCVVPLDPVYKQSFYVPADKGASLGDRVVMRFTGWANRHVNPEGEIVEVLGPADDPGTDTLSVIRHHEIPDVFPEAVMRDVERVSAIEDEVPAERWDLRSLVTATIDPLRARDFDDALSLEKGPDGRLVLGVHIADVSHYVRPGSALDEEARLRGNSVYFPDKVIPMLPEQLSNGLCSLSPDQDKLTVSVLMTLSSRGVVQSARIGRSTIRSRCRLTYEQAMCVLDDTTSGKGEEGVAAEVVALLQKLDRVAQQFRSRRFAQHALALDVPETEVLMDASSRIREVRAVFHDRSHQLVEECMLAANEVVASRLREQGSPFLSRFHDRPDPLRLEDLRNELVSVGFEVGDLSQRKVLSEFLNSVAGHPLEHHARVAVLKSMKRAVYSADEQGHYGLAKTAYTHFTSPIRRYCDLTVHRALTRPAGTKARNTSDRAEARATATHCTATEERAEKAERMVMELKKLRFLAEQIEKRRPEEYEAVVTRVTNFGLFVELPHLQVTGMIHVSVLSDRFLRFDRRSGTLRCGKTVFRLGDRMQVIPVKVDMDTRRVDFAPAGGEKTAPGARRRRRG